MILHVGPSSVGIPECFYSVEDLEDVIEQNMLGRILWYSKRAEIVIREV